MHPFPMPRPPGKLPLPISAAPFPVTRNGAMGVTRDRLRSSDIEHPHRGVAVSREAPASIERRAHAALLRPGPPSALSHVSGAELLGVPLPATWEGDPIHLTVAAPLRAPRGRGVLGHSMRLDSDDVRFVSIPVAAERVEPMPVLADPLLLLTLATQLRPPDLVAAIDALRFATRPLDQRGASTTRRGRGNRLGRLAEIPPRDSVGWVAAVTQLEQCRPGAPGLRKLRKAWLASEEGVRSRPESLLRLAIIGAQLPPPVVGFAVNGSGWAATPDLAWPEFGVLVEYEGDHHRTDRRQFAHDLERFDRYLDENWSPIRAVSEDLFWNPRPLLHRIAHRLSERGWKPPRRWVLRDVGACSR
ncbi:hypothetical protein EV141_0556 [Microcella putealis]|uniref:Transcriptional regulator, AbiEi antitoxin, Type IV TA system n=1 Tax=Microcella putealis TaxID=337005 RepID=A0A4Q7LWD2_9MICO|nr:hypothetical protein EV141_0556 [Microcella putealis]TQM19960.1 hypothetical protein BJ957_2093 [Microcella putealis]